MLSLEYDETKRQDTLARRGLDFADANQVFASAHFTGLDARFNYNEERYITAGFMNARLVIIVWTYRPNSIVPTHRRIISMRKANEREIRKFSQYLN